MAELSLFKIVGKVKARDYDLFEDLGLGGDIKNLMAVEVSKVGRVCADAARSAVPRKTEQLRRAIELEGKERGFLTDENTGRAQELESVRRVIVRGGFRLGKKTAEYSSDGKVKSLANTVTTNTMLAEILDEGRNEASRELTSITAASFFSPSRPRKFKAEQKFLKRKKKARSSGEFKDGDIPDTERRAPTRNWIKNAQDAAEKLIARME